MRYFAAVAALCVACLSLSTAGASTPSSGKVSSSSPSVTWGGTLSSSGLTYNAWDQDNTFSCNPPACDSYALTVEGGGSDLLVKLNVQSTNAADGGDPGCKIRVTDASRKVTLKDGNCGIKKALELRVKAAPAGTYTIDVASSHVCCADEDYKASAELPAFVTSTETTTAPAVTPPPAAAPATKLTATVPTLSAKKVNKAHAFTATVKTTAPLTGVRGLLVDKKRQRGQGSLASLSGTAKLKVKVKGKLKPGTYQLSVGGKDAQGASVVASAKIRVKR